MEGKMMSRKSQQIKQQSQQQSRPQLTRKRMSAQVVFAITLMVAHHAQAQSVVKTESSVESDSALDAEAIKSRVVISGSSVGNRAPVQSSLKATQPQSIITATFIEQSVTDLADFNAVARIAPVWVPACLPMVLVLPNPKSRYVVFRMVNTT
jgi:hypothetical protein